MAKSLEQLDLRGTGLCLCFNTRKVSRALTQVYDAALKPSGIRATQFAILVGVMKTERVSVGHLAQLLVTDPTTMTRNLRVMRLQGLVRISSRSQRRQRFVTLTDKGRRALAASLPCWQLMQERLVGRVGGQHWKYLQGELEKLTSLAIDEGSREGCKYASGAHG